MIRTAFALAIFALALSGCGERPQVISYKQGTYQGKPDTPAFSNPPFNNDRVAFENALRQRAQHQNEYRRMR